MNHTKWCSFIFILGMEQSMEKTHPIRAWDNAQDEMLSRTLLNKQMSWRRGTDRIWLRLQVKTWQVVDHCHCCHLGQRGTIIFGFPTLKYISMDHRTEGAPPSLPTADESFQWVKCKGQICPQGSMRGNIAGVPWVSCFKVAWFAASSSCQK